MKAKRPRGRPRVHPLPVFTDEIVHRLGTVPDKVLADEMGVNPAVVWKERNRRGIAPCGHTRFQDRGHFVAADQYRALSEREAALTRFVADATTELAKVRYAKGVLAPLLDGEGAPRNQK